MKKKRSNKHTRMRPQKAIRTDPRLNSQLHRMFLKLRVIPATFLNIVIPFIAKWDRRLGFKLIRLLLITAPTIVGITAKLFKAVFGTYGWLGSILSVYATIFHWIAAHGWLVLGMHLIVSLSFVPPVEGLVNRDAPMRKQLTPLLIFLTFWDLFTLFLSIKYLSGQPFLYTAWFLLTVATVWLMFKYRDYQEERGGFDPDRLLKEVRRRELKGL